MMAGQFTPDGDQCHHYPLLSQARAAVQAHDLAALRLTCQAADSWGLRDAIVQDAAEVGGEDFWRSAAADAPDDPWVLTVLGVCLTYTGWEIRGRGRASTVTKDHWQPFYEYLREAEQCLIRACAIDPNSPLAWRERLVTARGLGVGLEETRRRYARAAQIDPLNRPAQYQFLESLYPKWYGTWEDAFTFVHECAASAPAGAVTASIVVSAHMEKWALDRDADKQAFFTDRTRRREIEAAAAQSVLHPAFTQQFGWVEAATIFALTLSWAGSLKQARTCFEMLGPYFTVLRRFFDEADGLSEFLHCRKLAMGRK
ncbi:MAG: hypothetical protein LBJ62_02190 [Bifidobacteriaceae bacterium]|jgi:hypothetical protein|nr:hypothetical protein [Bifidobacteriaceae bacterium]